MKLLSLQPLREEQNVSFSVIIDGNKEYIKLILTYPQLAIPSIDGAETMRLSELWEKAEIPFREWSDMSGVPMQNVRKRFKTLKANNIILPDGTVNNLAYIYAQKMGTKKSKIFSVIEELNEMKKKKGDQDEEN